MGRRLLAAALAAASLLCVPSASAGAARDLAAYGGLGSWVDVWDTGAWASPERTVAQMHARGVATIFLETSNSTRPVDVVQPQVVARFVEAAHAQGMRIVAWYLPTLADLALDTRRSLAAIRFRTPDGQRFDSFALDIESSTVKRVPLRTARVLRLAARVRAAAGSAYPLGAIVPAPRGMELHPTYWPGFPFAQLARTFDVFLPMVYFTYHTHGLADSDAYVARNVGILRQRLGPELPIHVIGGVASQALPAQLRGFARATCASAVLGVSLYDYTTTKAGFWPQLDQAAGCTRPLAPT